MYVLHVQEDLIFIPRVYHGKFATTSWTFINEHIVFRTPKTGNWHGNELTYIDTAFIIIFPLTFLAFNLFYWPFRYLTSPLSFCQPS